MSIIGNEVNIVFDYLFIVRRGLGLGGAGLATSISQIFIALVGLIFVLKQVKLSDGIKMCKQLK